MQEFSDNGACQEKAFNESFLQTSLKDLSYVAFDTETTGRHPVVSRLLEVSGVKFEGSGKKLATYSQLIDPEQKIPQEVIAIHHITEEMVSGIMPTYKEVVPKFISWMQESDNKYPAVFLAHNAAFDIGFIQVALGRLGLALPTNPVLDTLTLSRKLVKNVRNYRLRTLAEDLGIASEIFHRAEADSETVMNLFFKIMDLFGHNKNLKDIIEVSGLLTFNDSLVQINNFADVGDPLVRSLGDAIGSRKDLEMHYRGQGIKFRRVTPQSVVFAGGYYYLNAFCHVACADRTFRIDRISNLEYLETKR